MCRTTRTIRGMTGRWFSMGSILTALATAICCVGPLLFSVLGVGTFASLWILRNLVPYRNLFFVVTFLFLGLGFYAAYRRGGHAQTFQFSKEFTEGEAGPIGESCSA